MKTIILSAALIFSALTATSQVMKNPNTNTSLAPVEKLDLTQEWDKVFPKSDKVDHKKVTFVNRYGITLAADIYTPKGASGKLPAIAISGPFGAVKRTIRPAACRTRFPGHCIRPFFHRRKWRHATPSGISRHQR